MILRRCGGCHLRKQIKKAVKIISLLLIPSIVIIAFFGGYLLRLFGEEYVAGGINLLRLLAISGIFLGINAVFISVFRVQKRIKELLFRNIIGSAITLILAYLFIPEGGSANKTHHPDRLRGPAAGVTTMKLRDTRQPVLKGHRR